MATMMKVAIVAALLCGMPATDAATCKRLSGACPLTLKYDVNKVLPSTNAIDLTTSSTSLSQATSTVTSDTTGTTPAALGVTVCLVVVTLDVWAPPAGPVPPACPPRRLRRPPLLQQVQALQAAPPQLTPPPQAPQAQTRPAPAAPTLPQAQQPQAQLVAVAILQIPLLPPPAALRRWRQRQRPAPTLAFCGRCTWML